MAIAWVAPLVTEVTITARWSNLHPVLNVLHIFGDVGTGEEKARDVLNNWQDHLLSQFADNYVLDGARWANHGTAGDETGFIIPDPAKPVVGAIAGVTVPPNVAVLVHKRATTTAAHRAGRMYLPPPQESGVDEDGVMLPATVTNLNVQLALFLDGINDIAELGEVNRALVIVHKVPGPTESDHSVVTGLQTDPLAATMRRRMR